MKRSVFILLLLVLTLALSAVPALAAEATPEPADSELMFEWLWEDDSDWTDADWLAWEKEIMGMPYMDGINVELNGSYLTFTDARPIIRDGRTMLPLRFIFEAMGAEVAWDAEAQRATATFADGAVISLTLDSPELTLTRGEEEETITMDVVPYLDAATDRILVPVRFLGEAAGYEVSWDDYFQLVTMTNPQVIIDAIDSRFTIYNSLLASESAAVDPEQVYSLNMKGGLDLTLYGDQRHNTASARMNLTGLTRGSDMSLDYRFTTEMNFIRDLLNSTAWDEEDLAELDQLEEMLSEITLNLILDSAADNIFVKSSLLPELLPVEDFDPRAWLQVSEAGLSQLELMTEVPTTVGGLIYLMSTSFYSLDQELLEGYASLMELMFGDKYITTSGSVANPTYTLKLDKDDLLAAAATDDGMWSIAMLMEELDDFSYSLVIKTKAGQLSSMLFDMQAETANASFGLTASGGLYDATVEMNLIGKYVGKLEMEMEMTMKESSKALPSAPPTGSVIIDVNSL